MKKVAAFLLIIIFSSLLSFGGVSAQTTNQCSTITTGNYPFCCPPYPTDAGVAMRCEQYRNSICTNNPNDPLCRPVNGPASPTGGTQSTNPRNSSNTLITGNESGIVPQSGSLELAACSAIRFKSAFDILVWVKCIIVAAIIPLIFAAAFLFFLWGVFKFMRATDAKGKQESQKLIWWGLLGLFVMVSVWGIIKILGTTLGIESTVPLLQTEYLKK